MKFLEPTRKPKVIYTDNSLKFGKSCEDLSWNHCTSTPHRSESIAERAVRRVKEGTSAVFLQSGLDNEWWADSMECYCYLRNIQDLLTDGKTPCDRRFRMPFNGPVIPFGAMVEYHPITANHQSRIHQFGKKVLPGLFLRYALYAGGIWKGDIIVADIEELETVDASEISPCSAKDTSRRHQFGTKVLPGTFLGYVLDAGGIWTDGTVNISGDQRLRTFTLIQDRPPRRNKKFFKENQADSLLQHQITG